MNFHTQCWARIRPRPPGSHTGRAGRGKSSVVQLCQSARQGTPQIISGIRVAAWKAGTSPAKQCRDSRPGSALPQQFLGDPHVGDAPIGLRESLWNPQPAQPVLINRAGVDRVSGWGQPVPDWRIAGRKGRHLALGCRHQSNSLAGPAQLGVHQSHPGRGPVALPPQGLLVGEASQPSQVAPIGAGQICPIEAGQLFGNAAGHGRFQRMGTHANPGLQVAGTGLEHDTGRMPTGPHQLQCRRTAMVQIQQNIASVTRPGVGLDINITALAVAHTQKSYGCFPDQLGGGPHAFSGKCSVGSLVNQPHQIQVAGHGRQLAANGLPRKKKSVIEHSVFVGETTRRTIHLWCAPARARVKTVSGNSSCCISRLSQKRAQSKSKKVTECYEM